MLLSFLGPSVSIGPIKVSLQGIGPAYPCSNVLLHYQNQDTSSSFLVKCRLFFFFFKYFVCLIDISWSQYALWPFLFSYISDHLPSKMTCYLVHIHSNTLNFALWFSSTFFLGHCMPSVPDYLVEVCLSP